MLARFTFPCLTMSALMLSALAGCNDATEPAPVEMSEGPPAVPPGAEHDHPTEGPHHGSLIELGNEEYHAELVHDDAAGTVTIYVLDGSAKQAVPIAAEDVTINLKHEGQPRQFTLAAFPEAGDPEGKSSRFVSQDKELAEALDAEGADARLVVKIDGKSYSGAIAHDHGSHDHGGHDH